MKSNNQLDLQLHLQYEYEEFYDWLYHNRMGTVNLLRKIMTENKKCKLSTLLHYSFGYNLLSIIYKLG